MVFVTKVTSNLKNYEMNIIDPSSSCFVELVTYTESAAKNRTIFLSKTIHPVHKTDKYFEKQHPNASVL